MITLSDEKPAMAIKTRNQPPARYGDWRAVGRIVGFAEPRRHYDAIRTIILRLRAHGLKTHRITGNLLLYDLGRSLDEAMARLDVERRERPPRHGERRPGGPGAAAGP